MELIFEIIAELIVEGGIEVSSNTKISKWIRYPIAIILLLFFAIVIFGVLFFGIILLKENTWAAIFMIVIAMIMMVGFVIKFSKVYSKEKENFDKE